MQRIYLYLIFIFLFAMTTACQQKEPLKPTITGELRNGANQKVYFERITDKGDEVIDSAIADANGKFSMPNHADKLDYYLLRTDDRNIAYLILQGNESITVKGDAKYLEQTYEVEGSEDTKLMLQMKRFERHLSDSINKLYVAFRDESPEKKDSMGMSLQYQYNSLMRAFALSFIPQNMNSIVSLSASLYLDKVKDLDLFEKLNSSLMQTWPENVYVQTFDTQLAEMRKLPIGSAAPEIKLKSPDGKEVLLSSMKGKLVLVEFWASWCGPCRKEMPRMVELYRNYKSRGFEILGVSLDDNVDAWKTAIRQDKITWPQGSDFKKWESEAVKDYGVEELHYTVLVDRKGNIAAKGLHGAELEIKIRETL